MTATPEPSVSAVFVTDWYTKDIVLPETPALARRVSRSVAVAVQTSLAYIPGMLTASTEVGRTCTVTVFAASLEPA